MCGQLIPRSLLWLVGLSAALLVGIMSCADDEDNAEEDNSEEWVGMWFLDTVEGQPGELLYMENVSAKTETLFSCSSTTHNNTWLFHYDSTWMAAFHFELACEEENPNPINPRIVSRSKSTYHFNQTENATYAVSGSRYSLTWRTYTGFADFFTYKSTRNPNPGVIWNRGHNRRNRIWTTH